MDEMSVIHNTMFQIGGPLHHNFIAWKNICWRIFETRVFLNEAQCNLWTRDQFWRMLCWNIMGSLFVWALVKQTCKSLRISFMLGSLDFMPSEQISNMSLNCLRRRVATLNKTITEPQMDEPLIALDLRHWVLTSGSHPLSIHCLEKHFLEDLWN
jgi:hypothetical protein